MRRGTHLLDRLIDSHEDGRGWCHPRQVAPHPSVQAAPAARLQQRADATPRAHRLQPGLDGVDGVQGCSAGQYRAGSTWGQQAHVGF